MKLRIDWKFVALVIGLLVGLSALDASTWAKVFAIAVTTVSNVVGYSDGLTRGGEMMKAKADEFFKQLQEIMADTMSKAKVVVQHSTQEMEHMRARLAKYEDVDDDRPVH